MIAALLLAAATPMTAIETPQPVNTHELLKDTDQGTQMVIDDQVAAPAQ